MDLNGPYTFFSLKIGMSFLKLIILLSLIPLPLLADTEYENSQLYNTSYSLRRVKKTSYSKASRDRNINKIYLLYKDKTVRNSYFLKELAFPI